MTQRVGGFCGTGCVLLVLCLLATMNPVSAVTHYSIPEEMEEGSVVANLAADLGLEVKSLRARKMRLDVVANKKYLDINKDTGELFIQERVDREFLCPSKTTSHCILKLDASIENPVRMFNIEVEITDINDNSPHFRRGTMHLDISESTPVGERFSLNNAADPDVGVNSVKNYHLSASDQFSIEIQTGRDGTKFADLVLKEPLDREHQAVHNLILTAVDGGVPMRTGTASIIVRVLDVNDNAPSFDKDKYVVDVMENSPIGSLVIKLNASDLDEGSNSDVVYSYSLYTSERTQSVFKLNPENGEIRVKEMINYEDFKLYEMEVIASDKGPNSLSGQCKVTIQVTDMNDNHPEISIKSFQTTKRQWRDVWGSFCLALLIVTKFEVISAQIRYSVQEETKSGITVGNVAKDLGLDVGRLTDRNLRVISGTKQDLFKVNPKDGVLIVNQRIDREELCAKTVPCVTNLKAVVENPLEMHQVIVEILDVNDNSPRFPEENHTMEVLESAIVGSRFQVEGAHDPDVGLNSIHSYKLNHNQYFRLETEDFGEEGKVPFLVLQRPLDREETAQHWLLLTAADGGKPSKSGAINVTVIVSDVNDNSPVCAKQKYTITIKENAPVGTFLLTVNASDPDEGVNGEIEYSLRSKSRGFSSEPFDLDSRTGKLTVKAPLDYEEKQVYEIKVLAADKGSVPFSTQCNVMVRVEDVNDNRPEIDITSFSSQIPEDATPGTVVALMGVTDLDSGVNGQVVCNVPGNLPFDLKPSPDGQSYSLVTKDYLDKEMTPIYYITITAKDLGSPVQSSTKVIQVEVLDVNDNNPLFTESPYNFYIYENKKAGTSLFSVSATDADKGENALISYSLGRKDPSNSITSILIINEANGTVSTLKSFDFERLKSFQLQVVATDSGAPSLSRGKHLRR
ncbi:protocadherin beta-15-like [Nematolebias whitei]|uniref:protocadherin beta-15-like n=1 Tax=Nematolebias whitei TaxID=451745 RepID=UPI00189816B9|nr:protocadherin beta-15-like [Nematolebias whitei]